MQTWCFLQSLRWIQPPRLSAKTLSHVSCPLFHFNKLSYQVQMLKTCLTFALIGSQSSNITSHDVPGTHIIHLTNQNETGQRPDSTRPDISDVSQPIRASWDTAAHMTWWHHTGNKLYSGDFSKPLNFKNDSKAITEKSTIEQFDMSHISSLSRPVSRFKSLYFCSAVEGEEISFLGPRDIFMPQYLKWPIEKIDALPQCLSGIQSLWHIHVN